MCSTISDLDDHDKRDNWQDHVIIHQLMKMESKMMLGQE